MEKMGFLLLRKKTYRKLVSSLLLMAFFVSSILVPLHDVWAAQVAIDATASTVQTVHTFTGSQVVFTTDQVGYKFYVDSNAGVISCVYSKTSDGGTSWAAPVQIDSQTDCFGVSVWYDKWTPGDSGNFIHILTADSGNDDLWYNRLDTTSDTRLLVATPVSTVLTAPGQGGTIAGGTNAGSITKGTDGTLYMTMSDNTDSYVVECTATCNLAASWTETGTNPLDLQPYYSILMPLANGDILLINRDITNDDIRSKVWNNSTWSATWTAVDANTFESATYDPQFSATINSRTGDIYIAYVDQGVAAGTIGGNDDDIKTATYSGGTWTANTAVITNATAAPAGLVDVVIGVNQYNGDVYVGYVGRTTAATATTGRVYWKVSTNAMTSWSAQTGPIDTVGADDKYGLSINNMSDQRLYITWYGITPDDIWGDTIVDIVPATILSTQGTQTTNIRASTTAAYVGGSFAITETGTTRNVTSIEITENGTIDGATEVDNIKLFYDLDTTAPYDCASESYVGSETQYGSTDTNGFSDANGNSTFTGSVSITTTQAMCIYTVLDTKPNVNNKTIELEVSAPTADVLVSGSVVTTPISAVAIAGTSNVVATLLTQNAYHWRNDNGNETAATSKTVGVENTSATIQQGTPVRLRVGVAELGATTTIGAQFRLEYAQNPSTCSAVSSWTDVNTTVDAWDMYDSTFVTNGDDTTNISNASGGVTNGNTTLLTPNGGQLDTTSQTGALTLSTTNYVELEYAIIPATTIPENTSYCFRVTNTGVALPAYTNYPQATVKLTNDFRIQRGVSTIAAAATTITITAGVDYESPNSTSTAFIRITNTGLTGAGQNTGAGTSNASNVMARISNPDNLLTSITFTRTGVTTNTRISWEIIEYQGVTGGENEMKVRRTESITYTNAVATLNGTVLTNVVDDADVAVFITGQGNPNANTTAYVSALSTAAWDGVNNRPVLTRAATTGAVPVSIAVVEFTGTNWKVQRTERTYTAVGATETNAITAVNSLSRTFLHVQKRASVNTHANLGQEVWLSGIGQVSFLLDAAATTPAGQTAVAWVIENTQTTGGTPLIVTRSNGTFNTTGVSPQANNVSIGKTLSDLSIASIFANNRSDTALTTWPEPILGARVLNATQYELWRSDISANIAYRTEIVEWPTAVRKLEQKGYWLYVDNDALKPTDRWPAGGTDLGEDTEMTASDGPMVTGDKIRIRMSIRVSGASMAVGSDAFKLQFGLRTTPSCSAVTTWLPFGETGSTTAVWRGVNNTPLDGALLSTTDPPTGGDLLLTGATVAGTYEEENNTANNPFVAFPTDVVEYDWVVQNNGAVDKSSYCFRMVEDDNTPLTTYTTYPTVRTVGYEPLVTNWRWYDDETNATPVTSRALENISPSNMEFDNAFKLRLVLRESSGADGVNVKFALQYSEYADFSQGVQTVTSTSTCSGTQLWCFHNGAGSDGAVIASSVISSADACSAGVGDGCGTYNEDATPGSGFTQLKYANTEYEFTLRHAGARSNRVYYFRLLNLTYSEVVGVAPTFSSPSLVTEGAKLTFAVAGLDKNTSTSGIITDATTTPTGIPFGTLALNTDFEAAQRISISSNATEGYQVLKYASQQLVNTYNDPVPAVTGTNASPSGWAVGCSVVAIGCFGYHTTDSTLFGGSSRFGATDSYAALTTTPQEIMYSSIPTADVQDIVYKMKITQNQPAGDYATSITYIAVPVH